MVGMDGLIVTNTNSTPNAAKSVALSTPLVFAYLNSSSCASLVHVRRRESRTWWISKECGFCGNDKIGLQMSYFTFQAWHSYSAVKYRGCVQLSAQWCDCAVWSNR